MPTAAETIEVLDARELLVESADQWTDGNEDYARFLMSAALVSAVLELREDS